MSCTFSALAWIPRGVAALEPKKWSPTDAELDELEERYGLEKLDEEVLKDELGMDSEETADESEQEKETVEPIDKAKKSTSKKKSKGKMDNSASDIMDVDMDDAEGEESSALNCFSTTIDELELQDDPLLEGDADSDSEDDGKIKPTDNLFLACSCEEDECTLEVFCYDEEEGAMFVHHDIMLNAYPLCVDWVDFGQGKNYAAVGQFNNNIDIWDLDVLEQQLPVSTLGGSPSITQPSKYKRSKKYSSNKEETGHTGAVMCLNAHPTDRNLLVSGGADDCVKLWDLKKAKCLQSFEDLHTDKVQCVKWHKKEASAILTASYDKTCCLVDIRNAAKNTMRLNIGIADPEQLCWDNKRENIFYVSTEDGKVLSFDARKLDHKAPLFTLSAYTNSACSGIAQLNDVLVTGSTNGVAKVYDLKNGTPTLECEKTMAVGQIFSVAGARDDKHNSDSMFLFGGETVALWDLREQKALCDKFGWTWEGN